jgi:bifunctional non-homologous end joining protein LigD
MRLPTSPMLAKTGPLPAGPGWSHEVKWDGFRALVSTVDGLKVRSRRGWNMTEALPELRACLTGWCSTVSSSRSTRAGDPHFPLLSKRILNRDTSVPVQFMIFERAGGRRRISHRLVVRQVQGPARAALSRRVSLDAQIV